MDANAKNYFGLTLEECKMVLDHIGGLIVVDAEGKIKYMDPQMYERIAAISGGDMIKDVVGKPIASVHPTSRLCSTIKTRTGDNEYFYFSMGITNVARIRPLFSKGTFMGAIDFDLYGNADELKQFFDKMVKLSVSGVMDFSDSIDIITTNDKRLKNVKYCVSDIIGTSPAMIELKKKIYGMSLSESTVLIEAETGCGKELAAHSIHNISRRRANKLVEINCAAIPENLVESELFGYEEGAFTGAKKGGKIGKFELADKGTLFLDEVDQLPYHVQPKLLRALQEKEVTRIGGRTVPVNIRVIAATNKNLSELVAEGKFREDLYYRLNVIKMKIPPLRERKQDIPLLAENQRKRLNDSMAKSVKGISKEAMELFMNYSWPGNVRQLNNVLESAMNLCEGEILLPEHFEDFFAEILTPNVSREYLSEENPIERAKNAAEAEVIKKALEVCGYNKAKTAAMLKISRTALYHKIERFHIKRENAEKL